MPDRCGQTRQYEWTDQREWYAEPLTRGTCTLYAIANIRGAGRLPSGTLRDWFHTTDADRSNPVT